MKSETLRVINEVDRKLKVVCGKSYPAIEVEFFHEVFVDAREHWPLMGAYLKIFEMPIEDLELHYLMWQFERCEKRLPNLKNDYQT